MLKEYSELKRITFSSPIRKMKIISCTFVRIREKKRKIIGRNKVLLYLITDDGDGDGYDDGGVVD